MELEEFPGYLCKDVGNKELEEEHQPQLWHPPARPQVSARNNKDALEIEVAQEKKEEKSQKEDSADSSRDTAFDERQLLDEHLKEQFEEGSATNLKELSHEFMQHQQPDTAPNTLPFLKPYKDDIPDDQVQIVPDDVDIQQEEMLDVETIQKKLEITQSELAKCQKELSRWTEVAKENEDALQKEKKDSQREIQKLRSKVSGFEAAQGELKKKEKEKFKRWESHLRTREQQLIEEKQDLERQKKAFKKEKEQNEQKPGKYLSPILEDEVLSGIFSSLQEIVPDTILEHELQSACESLSEQCDLLLQILKQRKHWSKDKGFTSSQPGHLLFLLIVNKIYRIGGECNVCPLCGCLKTSRRNNQEENEPLSHIFPNACLEAFCRIHGASGKASFWNCSKGEYVSPKKISFKILCQKCETDASPHEKKLSNLYAFLSMKSDHKVVIDSIGWWYLYVAARIMFLGALVNLDLMKELNTEYADSLVTTLFELQTYCDLHPEHSSKVMQQPTILQFLLPAEGFDSTKAGFLYHFDLQLRNPQLASSSVCSCEARTIFLYTQFDCFHWVCLLTQEASCKCFDNGSMIPCSGNVVFHSAQYRKYVFCESLLEINRERCKEVGIHVLQHISNSQLTDNCKAFIRSMPDVKLAESKKNKLLWPGRSISEGYAEEVADHSFDENAAYIKELDLEKAPSPLRAQIATQEARDGSQSQLQEVIDYLKNQVDDLERQNERKDEEITLLKQEIERLRAQITTCDPIEEHPFP